MPAPTYSLRNYAGGAALTTLSAGIAAGTVIFTVTDGSTFPASAFFCVIDEGLSTEEKIYVATRSGNDFSGVSRGEDGTVGQAHSGAPSGTVRHVGVAQDFREANAVASVLTTKGDLLGHGFGAGPARVPAGLDGTYLRSASAQPNGLIYTSDPLEVTDYDAKGDLLVGTGADAMSRLAVGANGKALIGASGAAGGLVYDYPISIVTTAARDALAGADLWRGRVVFNSDTGALEVYYGATTLWRPPWNTPWGAIGAPAVSAGSPITSGATATNFLTGNAFTALALRNYVVTATLMLTGSVAGDVFGVEVRDGGTAGAVLAIAQRVTSIVGATQIYSHRSRPFTLTSASHTPWIVVTRLSGTGTMQQVGGEMAVWIEDVGPSANAPAS